MYVTIIYIYIYISLSPYTCVCIYVYGCVWCLAARKNKNMSYHQYESCVAINADNGSWATCVRIFVSSFTIQASSRSETPLAINSAFLLKSLPNLEILFFLIPTVELPFN